MAVISPAYFHNIMKEDRTKKYEIVLTSGCLISCVRLLYLPRNLKS